MAQSESMMKTRATKCSGKSRGWSNTTHMSRLGGVGNASTHLQAILLAQCGWRFRHRTKDIRGVRGNLASASS